MNATNRYHNRNSCSLYSIGEPSTLLEGNVVETRGKQLTMSETVILADTIVARDRRPRKGRSFSPRRPLIKRFDRMERTAQPIARAKTIQTVWTLPIGGLHFVSLALLCSTLFVGCTDSEPTVFIPTLGSSGCVDNDGDGYGVRCANGLDCDDSNPEINRNCPCHHEQEGCLCEDGHEPVSCYDSTKESENGDVMCTEGTRFCRDGVWGACESLVTYRPTARQLMSALVDHDSGAAVCDPCMPKCFVIDDPLEPIDGGLCDASEGCLELLDGGGLSLSPDCGVAPETDAGDAGVPIQPDGGTDAGADAGEEQCVVTECQASHIYECGDCVDNDGDGFTDMLDPDCLGPCHNSEANYYGNIPGQNNAPCKHDCYFDKDTGHGNDDCFWNHVCDPLEPQLGCTSYQGPDYVYPSSPSYCGDDGTSSCTCGELEASQTQTCHDTCLPLTPPGCDCFGCCELPASSGNYVWIGTETPKITGSKPESGNKCTKYTYGDHDYYVCTSQWPMFIARLLCTWADMDLAAVTTKGEAEAVAGFIEDKLGSSQSAWIGASYESATNKWSWDTLEKPFWQGDASGGTLEDMYANWAPGQPTLGNTDCVIQNADGTWTAKDCFDISCFVRQSDGSYDIDNCYTEPSFFGYVCEEIGGPTCDRFSVENPDRCHPCTPVSGCFVPCEECDYCIGKTELPESCVDPEPIIYGSGSYWQDMDSRTCVGNDRPNWNELTWTANVPEGTSISFSICTAETKEALVNCADAPTQGQLPYLHVVTTTKINNAIVLEGSACIDSSDCPSTATCSSGTCAFSNQPINISGILDAAGLNHRQYLRAKVAFNPDASNTSRPTLYDWQIKYDCQSIL